MVELSPEWRATLRRQEREASERRVRKGFVASEAALNPRKGDMEFRIVDQPDPRAHEPYRLWGLPRLIGLSIQWPVVWPPGEPCPCCGFIPWLPDRCVCLVCDRGPAEPVRLMVERKGRLKVMQLAGGTGPAKPKQPRPVRAAPEAPGAPPRAAQPPKPPKGQRVAVVVTRAILRHQAGDVVRLRASQAASWIAAGVAVPA